VLVTKEGGFTAATVVSVVLALIAMGVTITMVVLAIKAVKSDHILSCVNISFSSLALFFVISLIIIEGNLIAVIFISLIFTLIMAVVSLKLHDYTFIISTALTGGFIACLAGMQLLNITNLSLDRFVVDIVWFGGEIAIHGIEQIIIASIVLATISFFLQLLSKKHLKRV
jgi:hypothetical protein